MTNETNGLWNTNLTGRFDVFSSYIPTICHSVLANIKLRVRFKLHLGGYEKWHQGSSSNYTSSDESADSKVDLQARSYEVFYSEAQREKKADAEMRWFLRLST